MKKSIIINKILNKEFNNRGKTLIQLEALSKLRRYGPVTYKSFTTQKSDFVSMFVYLESVEQILSELDNVQNDNL